MAPVFFDADDNTFPWGHDAVPWDRQEPNAFKSIQNKTYLLNRTDVDLYDILVACFSLRANDSYTISKLALDGSIYQSGFTSSAFAFKDFLVKAYEKDILPPGFDREEMDRCVESARPILRRKISPGVIAKTYATRDEKVVVKLRCLGEVIYGTAVGGENNNMLDRMVAIENGVLTP